MDDAIGGDRRTGAKCRRGAERGRDERTAQGRGKNMLENKRERLKTFLRKIDEKAIVRIKHFMKERWVGADRSPRPRHQQRRGLSSTSVGPVASGSLQVVCAIACLSFFFVSGGFV